MDTKVTENIRERLTALNTKAYYLLVALAFIYIQSGRTPILNLALTLTAAVAVLPVQDFLKSVFWLEFARTLKILCLLAALGCTLWWAWSPHTAAVAAGQKPAPPQTTEQQKPKESAGDIDSRLRELEEKSSDATKERADVERSQKEVKEYYEKAFDTQVKFLEWLIILIAALPIVAGFFSFRINDRTIQQSLNKVTIDLEKKFDEKLAAELKKLIDSNAAQLTALEDGLNKRITKQEENLKLRSDFQFQFLQGMTGAADERYDDAVASFRRALVLYKSGKPEGVVQTRAGERAISNLFKAMWGSAENESERDRRAREELNSELYDGLEDELAQASLRVEWLAPLVRDRKAAPHAAEPATPTPAPATPQESPEPMPDNTQPPKPKDGKEKK